MGYAVFEMASTTETVEKPKTTIRCAQCGKEVQIAKRMPLGWKHPNDQDYFCSNCWQSQYMLRAVILPVVSPLSISWEELRKVMDIMWAETTRASNWMIRQLLAADVIREPGVPKMPPMPRSYLYPEARKQFPALPAQTISSLEQAITRKYKDRRYDVIWLCKAAPPTFRYPQPFPCNKQSWSAEKINGAPVISIRIGDSRVKLRLKGTALFRRHLQAFDAIVDGPAIPGECAIYEQDSQIMVKIAAWLPRRAPSLKEDGTLAVRSTGESLMVAVNGKDKELWKYHADQIPRFAAQHRRQLQRWADDSKFEQRPVPLFSERRQEASVRYHRRVNSAADQAAAYLVKYARRRKFAAVSWDSTDRSFCADFVWFRLENRIKMLCDEYGIEYIKVEPKVADKEEVKPVLPIPQDAV
jgi:hypothetical protein